MCCGWVDHKAAGTNKQQLAISFHIINICQQSARTTTGINYCTLNINIVLCISTLLRSQILYMYTKILLNEPLWTTLTDQERLQCGITESFLKYYFSKNYISLGHTVDTSRTSECRYTAQEIQEAHTKYMEVKKKNSCQIFLLTVNPAVKHCQKHCWLHPTVS